MADHIRETIIERVKTLVTGLATTGTNVHRLRSRPEHTDEVPSLNVVQGADAAVDQETGQLEHPFVERRLEVHLEARVRGTGAVEETINEIEKEVIQALQVDHTLGVAGVLRVIYLSTTEPIIEEGSQRVGLAVITHAVDYVHLVTDPSVATT